MTPGLRGVGLLSLLTVLGCDLNYRPAPYVHNLTRERIHVQVRFVDGTPTCDLLPQQIGFFTEEDFGPSVRYRLDPGGVLPITDPTLEPDVPEPRLCAAAIVRVGETSRVLHWDHEGLHEIPQEPTRNGAASQQALQVGGGGGRYFFRTGFKLGTASLRGQDNAPPCDAPVAAPIAWSGLPNGTHELAAVREGADGCLVLEHGSGTGFVCVPPRMFPFVAGQRIEVAGAEGFGPDAGVDSGANVLRIRDERQALELRRGSGFPAAGVGSGEPVAATCAPVRDTCGSLVLPARAPIGGLLVEAGSEVRAVVVDALARVYLGRVEQVALVRTGCERAGSRGFRVDLAIVQASEAQAAAPDDDAGVNEPRGHEVMDMDDAGRDLQDDGGVGGTEGKQ
ncbi:MAG: hypothetical protein OXT09_30565 [Myxococcales bacterium]|nr:hypothetical protein [Myxococcales bacterium]